MHICNFGNTRPYKALPIEGAEDKLPSIPLEER